MRILVLNGSARINGGSAAMVDAFARGAREAGHVVDIFPVARMKIAGCLGCEYCHGKGNGTCVQQDDMQQIYPCFAAAEMLVLASPIYYLGISGQLQCAISRTYSIGIPGHLKKAALFLSSGAENVYAGAIYAYRNGIIDYMGLEDQGIYTAYGEGNRSAAKLDELYQLGRCLQE